MSARTPEEQLDSQIAFAQRGIDTASDHETQRYWYGYRTALEWARRELLLYDDDASYPVPFLRDTDGVERDP